jgi:hypothetical protein
MQLEPSEIQDLINLVEYTIANESNSYEEYVSEGGNPEDHIYWSARRLLTSLQLQEVM